MEILQVQSLSKTYGRGEAAVHALQGASFTLQKGEFAAVVGASGSGKSTLLHCIGGLEQPTAGKVFIDGVDLFALPEVKRTVFRRKHIGFVFQQFHLIPELDVEQNILFPLLLDGRRPDPEEIGELLALLGLEERRHHLPSQLSGGQQQRAAIGRALAARPALILADEPTGNLDSKASRDVMELLTTASRQYGQTVLMITHNTDLTTHADRVLQVADGVLTDLGGVRE